jgi:hypothetical protein
MTNTRTYEGCCEHGELLDKYCDQCDVEEPKDNPCKCKSESERMVECCRKLNKAFHTKSCTAMIYISPHSLEPSTVHFYTDHEYKGTQFKSIDAFESWANSICDNPMREIVHRRFKL